MPLLTMSVTGATTGLCTLQHRRYLQPRFWAAKQVIKAGTETLLADLFVATDILAVAIE